MHMGSYKSLSFFQVSETGWFHTFTELQNHSDRGWDDVWSRWCFLHVHLDHVQLKSQSQDYVITSRSAIWLQNLNCAWTWTNSKDAEKMFVSRPLTTISFWVSETRLRLPQVNKQTNFLRSEWRTQRHRHPFLFLFFSSSTGELCSQPIRGNDRPIGRILPTSFAKKHSPN